MSVWTNFRIFFRQEQRVRPQTTVQLTLEELGARLAPGSLLGGAGQTAFSFLGQPAPSNNPPARVATPAPIVTAAGVTTAPTSATPSSVSNNLQAVIPASLDNNASNPVDGGDTFVDSLSSPTPVPAPTVASSDGGNSGPGANPVVETASPMSSATPNVTAPSASANANANLVSTAPPTVALQVPDFVGRGTPQVTVTVGEPVGVPANTPIQVHIDVDLRHDGKFTDAGDSSFAAATINGSGTIALTKPLASGTYTLRAWAVGSNGSVGFSDKETMTVDTNAGFVGSQPLLDLAHGFLYGTTTPIGGGGGSGENSGASEAAIAKAYSFLEFDQQGRVLVDVHSGVTQDLSALESELQSNLGFSATGVYPSQNIVTGWLPVNQILNLPNVAHFASIDPVFKPEVSTPAVPNVGSYPTDADPVIHSDTFRTNNNVDGTGVKVGVISTSINQVGGGIAASQATGDLPPNVQVLEDELDGMGTDEGRAMSEIVHHVAPGASLAFHSGFNGELDMATGITDLVNAGAKVITDDITYFDEPAFNDGIIAQAGANAVTDGTFYTTSANNNADHAYEAPFRPITATVGGVTGTFQDITGGNTALQTFSLGVGDTTTIGFTWDAAYLEGGAGQGTGNFAVPNNFIAQVTDANGNALSTPQVFDAMATSTNEAFDDITFTNDGTFGTNNFAFSFQLASGPAPTMVRWESFDDGNPAADPMALEEGARASFGHETAVGVVTTGAANVMTPTTIEPFSALGGNIGILFDVNGNRLATPDIRVEPEVVAPDGVQTSFFSAPANNGVFRFFGTSAATPHVAAAAALLMQQAPGATPAEVTAYLEQNALAINDPGFAGAGLIQLNGPLAVPTPPTPPTPPPVTPVIPVQIQPNQTSDTAEDLGTLTVGTPVSISGEDITRLPDGRNDYNWFRFTPATAGLFSATETTSVGGNLELHLFTLVGNTLVQLANVVTPGVSAQTLSLAVGAGQPILVEIKGENSSFGLQDAGVYQLDVSLT